MDAQQPPAASLSRSSSLQKRWLSAIIQGLIILVVLAGFVALRRIVSLPARLDDQQTFILGSTRFAPDSKASLRVVVQDFAAGKPIANADVQVSLMEEGKKPQPLFEGATNATGSLPVDFHLPADAPAQATLVVEVSSAIGQDRVEKEVTIQRDYRLLLSSDKPLYQPGQVIHLRTLALGAYDLVPANGETVKFLIEDPKGNKVFRKEVTASEFGIAAVDFTLADVVNQGNYKLTASIGETSSEKTVEVRPYVLPKFAVEVTTDKSFYLPGEKVEGVVQADYFFGKPVAQGEIEIIGSVWDVERTVVVDLRGQTDDSGSYSFSFDLPEYFAGSGLDSGQAQFALEVSVIDQTDHAEQASQVLPVSAQPLLIEGIAESGMLKPGVENVVYLLTSYPDGRPARTRLEISQDGGSPVQLSTGEYGLSRYSFIPQQGAVHSLSVTAVDERGRSANRQLTFESEGGQDSVLLRADRAAYVVGETMELITLTAQDYGDVYLDIVKTGQTLSTRSEKVVEGGAEFFVDVTPEMYGTLELHAYKVLLDGTIVRDTRLVVVDAPKDIEIAIRPDQETYLPGDPAKIDFQTQAADGSAIQTALGLAIVDESVFALQRQDPGFAKLYFMLEQELMEPFYQVKGFELPAAMPSDQDQIRYVQDEAAKASWAGAATDEPGTAINSRQEKMNALQNRQEKGYQRMNIAALAGMIIAPGGLFAVAATTLTRAGLFKRSLGRVAIASGAILLVVGCLVGGLMTASRFYYYFDPEPFLIALGGIFGLGALAFFGYAWVQKDPSAQYMAVLTLAWGGSIGLLLSASNLSRSTPPTGLIFAAALAYLFIPGGFLFFGQGRWLQNRRLGGGLATGLGALSALPAFVGLPAAFLLLVGGGFGAMAPAPEDMLDLAAGQPEIVRELAVEAEMDAMQEESAQPSPDEQTAGEPPRLRQYFPETLYWAPEVITNQEGFVSLDIPMADSITTWRLTALASSQDGQLGFNTQGIRVFQDFFVDIDLPVALTQGDQISIPVGVFNYLPEAQDVRLVVEEEDWFELLGGSEQELSIASNDIEVVYFPIQVKEFGRQGFQVTAWGSQMSDAIRREVRVLPDGKEIRLTESDWLRENKQVALQLPAEAVPETSFVEVKIYPGVMAQVIEGLEKILRLPHG